jgi:hypothetical protein
MKKPSRAGKVAHDLGLSTWFGISPCLWACRSTTHRSGMLPDLDSQRCERLFFALRLDHDVCFPTVEGIE